MTEKIFVLLFLLCWYCGQVYYYCLSCDSPWCYYLLEVLDVCCRKEHLLLVLVAVALLSQVVAKRVVSSSILLRVPLPAQSSKSSVDHGSHRKYSKGLSMRTIFN